MICGKNTFKGTKCRIWLYLMIGAILLWGCAKEEDETADSSIHVSRDKYHSNEPFTVENPEDVNLADLLQMSAAGVMVQITMGARVGSGVIFSIDKEHVVIATAAHVMEGQEEIDVLFADGLRLKGDKSWTADGIDLGFIRFDTDQIPEESLEQYCFASVDKAAYDDLSTGDGLIVMGSIDGVAANAYEGSILETWIYVEDLGQYMMTGKAYSKAGMSGGGVFDSHGHLIGIISGGRDESEILAVPLGVVLSQFSLYSGQ